MCESQLVWNLQPPSCLWLLNAGIIGIYSHVQVHLSLGHTTVIVVCEFPNNLMPT